MDNFKLIESDMDYHNGDGRFKNWVNTNIIKPVVNATHNVGSTVQQVVSNATPNIGIGGGRKKACKEAGLTGDEKRDCARQLKAAGWKKGQPIPPEFWGVDPEYVEQVEPTTAEPEPELASDPNAPPTDKILLYGSITVGGVVLLSLITWGLVSMAASPKST